jgi:hypothetical protein
MRRVIICVCFALIQCAPIAWSQTTPHAMAPAIHGQGKPGAIPRFTANNQIGNSIIFEANGSIQIGGQLESSVNSSDGFAIVGTNQASTGDPMGLLGTTVSADRGIGVRGQAENPLGSGIGVLGEAAAPNGIAVFGSAFSETGGAIGVLGNVNSPDGFGVMGMNLATTGDPVGLLGNTHSVDRGIGVRAQASSATGNGIALLAESSSPNGVAGVFNAIGGGTILQGIASNAATVFRVDIAGTVFANGGLQVGGADFAESLPVVGERSRYEPGDLLVIDRTGNRRMALADTQYSTLVAGIYSTKPGLLSSPHAMDDLAKEVPMAVVGIVPCKASTENGPINIGDLLVSSSTPGHAMKGTDRSKMLGAVVGKALEPLREGKGVVQVLVTLQ